MHAQEISIETRSIRRYKDCSRLARIHSRSHDTALFNNASYRIWRSPHYSEFATSSCNGQRKISKPFQIKQRNQMSATAEASRPSCEIAGKVKVEVLNAKSLNPAVLGNIFKIFNWTPNYSNPYAVVSLAKESHLTTTQEETLNPIWKESFNLHVPLPTEQEFAQSLVSGGGPSSYHSSKVPRIEGSKHPYYACFPEVLVEVYHRSAIGDKNGIVSKTTKGFEEDTLIGEVSIPLLPCILSPFSTHRSWYTLYSHDHNEAGQIQIALHYDVSGLEPMQGDIIRLSGFGGVDYYAKLLPIQSRMEVLACYQDRIFAQCKTSENWRISLELHRNLVCVVRRPSKLKDLHSRIGDRLVRARNNPLVLQAADIWSAIPDSSRHPYYQTRDLAKLTGMLLLHTAKLTLDDVQGGGIKKGVETCISSTCEAAGKIQEELLKTIKSWDARRQLVFASDTMSRELSEQSGPPEIVAAFTSDDVQAAKLDGSFKNAQDQVYTEMDEQDEEKMSHPCPGNLICPITGCQMIDPVVAADGHSYEREAILHWFKTSMISPMTGVEVSTIQVFPNYTLRTLSEELRGVSTTQQDNSRQGLCRMKSF